MRKIIVSLLAASVPSLIMAQTRFANPNDTRVISTAVPMLVITPDSKAAALGETGVATASDASATFWNPGKLATLDKKAGIAISYNPWLRKLVGDMSLSYLTAYYSLKKGETVAFSLSYMNFGNIDFTDQQGNSLGSWNAREFAPGITYSKVLSKKLSVGLTLKYIRSNLTGNNGSLESRPAQSAGADFGLFYKTPIKINGTNNQLALGLSVSNIGAKVNYTNNGKKDFLPGIIRLGSAFTRELDFYNKFTLSCDLSKLLVPSTPIMAVDSVNRPTGDIYKGKNTDKPLMSGIFGSFADAPNGGKEELQEIMVGTGIEYLYNNAFAIRAGYFYENPVKGSRRYFTIGVGFKTNAGFGLDFAYLVPQKRTNPLADTWRFTLNYDLRSTAPTESPVE